MEPNSAKKYSRAEVQHLFGIDLTTEIVWKGWGIGGEISKSLILKNITTRTQHITYKIPKTVYFFMNFPEKIKLSPGMSHTLDIKFRPLEYTAYCDTMEVVTEKGNFKVELKALLPSVKLIVPDLLDAGIAPAGETFIKPFFIENRGEVPIDFSWKSLEPFDVLPSSGKLAPGQKLKQDLYFRPTDASVFVSSCICRFFGEQTKIMKVSGIGKYPFITVPQKEIDFGEIPIGNSNDIQVSLQNKSLVPATFSVTEIIKDETTEPTFRFTPSSGVIPPESEGILKCTFTPIIDGTFSCSYFKISTPGGNQIIICCKGYGTGPCFELNSNSLNFGNVPLGKTSRQILEVKNLSDCKCDFSIQSEKNGIFKFEQTTGTLAPKESRNVLVIFEPRAPINFYKRVVVLIKNQYALYFDAFGSGYNDKKRPAPFGQKEIDDYRKLVKLGLGLVPLGSGGDGEMNQSLTDAQKVKILNRDSAKIPNICSTVGIYSNEEKRMALNEIMEEFFISPSDEKLNPVSIHEQYVYFGTKQPSKSGFETKTVTVKNNTSGKVVTHCFVPTDAPDYFQVEPEFVEIKPFSTEKFTISFRPNDINKFFTRKLEFFSYYKQMRSFRLVTKDNFTPPWYFDIIVDGNSFENVETFITKGRMDPPKVISFSPCLMNDASYRVVKIINESDIPMPFGYFENLAKRLAAEIAQKEEEEKKEKEAENQKNPENETDPSNPEAESSKNVNVSFANDENHAQNQNPNPSEAHPKTPRTPKQILPLDFTCKPDHGIVCGNSFRLICFKFHPKTENPQSHPVNCVLNHCESKKLNIQVIGRGNSPLVKIENDGKVFFKPTHTGGKTERVIKLENFSTVTTNYTWKIPKELSKVFKIDAPVGVLRGNETIYLKWTFTPKEQKRIVVKIPCEISNTSRFSGVATTSTVHVTVVAEGTTGGVLLDAKEIDFKTVLVGESKVLELTVFNSNDCDIPYRTFIREVDLAQFSSKDNPSKKPENDRIPSPQPLRSSQNLPHEKLKCIRNSEFGILPARTQKTIYLQYTPSQRRSDAFQAIVALPFQVDKTLEDSEYTENELTLFETSTIYGEGSYPFLSVIDIKSNAETCKAELWKRFSISGINEELLGREGKNTTVEIKQDDSHMISFNDNIQDLKRFLCDFGTQIVGYEDTFVYFKLQNYSELPAEFSFFFAKDKEMKVELWAETPETQLQTTKAENSLFEILPSQSKTGTVLRPTESKIIAIKYKHLEPGTHTMPVLFQVKNGRSIVIDLRGKTIGKDEKHLYFTSFEHEFAPICIGNTNVPTYQYYTLQNPCEEEIHYEIDLEPLKKLTKDNFNFEILKLENPSGTVPRNGTEILKFVFMPLETKEYEVELPISIETNSYFVTFKGKGVNQNNSAEISKNFNEFFEPLILNKEYDEKQKIFRKLYKKEKDAKENKENREIIKLMDLPTAIIGDSTQTQTLPKPNLKTENIINRNMSDDLHYKNFQKFLDLHLKEAPQEQLIPVIPQQTVKFSMEVIKFGNVAALSVSKNILTIGNLSKSDTYSFNWKTNLPKFITNDQISDNSTLHRDTEMMVIPQKGKILPNSTAIVKVILKAGSFSQILNCDVECIIENESEKEKSTKKRLEMEQVLVSNIHDQVDEEVSDTAPKTGKRTRLYMKPPLESFLVPKKPKKLETKTAIPEKPKTANPNSKELKILSEAMQNKKQSVVSIETFNSATTSTNNLLKTFIEQNTPLGSKQIQSPQKTAFKRQKEGFYLSEEPVPLSASIRVQANVISLEIFNSVAKKPEEDLKLFSIPSLTITKSRLIVDQIKETPLLFGVSKNGKKTSNPNKIITRHERVYLQKFKKTLKPAFVDVISSVLRDIIHENEEDLIKMANSCEKRVPFFAEFTTKPELIFEDNVLGNQIAIQNGTQNEGLDGIPRRASSVVLESLYMQDYGFVFEQENNNANNNQNLNPNGNLQRHLQKKQSNSAIQQQNQKNETSSNNLVECSENEFPFLMNDPQFVTTCESIIEESLYQTFLELLK